MSTEIPVFSTENSDLQKEVESQLHLEKTRDLTDVEREQIDYLIFRIGNRHCTTDDFEDIKADISPEVLGMASKEIERAMIDTTRVQLNFAIH